MFHLLMIFHFVSLISDCYQICLQEEIAKRSVAITAAAAPEPPPPQPTSATVQHPPSASQLPAILEMFKSELARMPTVEASLTDDAKDLVKKMADGMAFFETFTATACQTLAAVTQEVDFLRGVTSTAAQPDDLPSPERTVQQQQHPLLEQDPPPPLPHGEAASSGHNALPAVAPVVPATWPMPNPDGATQAGDNQGQGNGIMATDETLDPKRKAPRDEEHFKNVMAVVRAGKAKGAGKGEGEQPAKRGKTEGEEA